MSRNRRHDESDDEEGASGVAVALGLVAGIAVAGGVAYGIKKLYDHEKEKEEKLKVKPYPASPPSTSRATNWWDDDNTSGKSFGNPFLATPQPCSQLSIEPRKMPLGKSLNNYHDEYASIEEHVYGIKKPASTSHATFHAITQPRQLSIEPRELSLAESLNNYHDDYANIEEHDMARAMEVVSDIKESILLYFHDKFPGLVSDLQDSGSVAEGLKVIRPNEFDVMIPLNLNTRCLTLRSDYNVPGFYILEENFNESRNEGLLGDFIKEDFEMSYLSPERLRQFFQGKMQKAINRIPHYDITSGNKGPAVLLDVTYDRYRKTSIDFVPVLNVENIQVVAKPHPKYLQKKEQSYERYWRESFSMKERRIIADMPARACHRKCLKIMKAVRLNHFSQFGMLSSYVYKTILLHMLAKTSQDDWDEDCLEERCKQFFEELQECVEQGSLRHYFDPKVNLLEQFGSQPLLDVNYYLARIIRKGSYKDLLSTRGVEKYRIV